MEYFTNGTEREIRHGEQRRANLTGPLALCLVLCLIVVAAAFVVFAGSASATRSGAAEQVGSVQGIPAAQETAPAAVETGAAPPVQTGGTGPVEGALPSVGPTASNQGATAGTQGGGFPWWILIPLLLALAAVAFLVARRRRTVEVTTAPGPPGQRPYTGTTTTTTYTTASAAGLGAAGAATPTEIVCPNCGATNGLNENFCHDCGQDLRQARAQLLAPALDIVDEYTPYLETQSRVDEQLEYVLSRARVTIGSAPGNDIVIDAAFNGSGTVGATHAELRREGDGFLIVDLGSGTGVYVNGDKVAESALKDNDEVRVGDVQFVYHAPPRP
ncbi:MAG TPA: FHA domain-containing protein [Chloroflexia bacterium]